MDRELLTQRLYILNQMSNGTIIQHGNNHQSFRSNVTQFSYYVKHNDATLVRPILRVHKTLLRQSIYLVPEDGTKDNLFKHISSIKNSIVSEEQEILTVDTLQIYTDKIHEVHKWLMDSKDYIDLTKEHKGIKEIFSDNIYKGTTELPRTEAYDFTDIQLYKHKSTNELILVSNYILQKKIQNKYGLLNIGSKPNDFNYLILLGLMPAFIPEFKDRLDDNEKEFFKLLTTPVKVFHERATAVLYEQIILTPLYDTLIRGFKIERMRQDFRRQEERVFNDAVSNASYTVEQLSLQLFRAEEVLIMAEKELAYYTAGDSKFEDAVTYIFEHAYLLDVNYSDGVLNCSFRVPLSQWDTEIATTILKGLNTNPSRYSMNADYLKDIKHFIQYILIDQIAKYWILAEFSINLNTFEWRVKKAFMDRTNSFQPDLFMTYKAGPNPHMEYHSCVGSYRNYIDKAMQRKDLPGMIECILAPYKNWNLADGIVMGKMFSSVIPGIAAYNIGCIEYKGNMVSIKELHQLIEEEKKPKEEPAPAPKKRTRKARVLNEDDAVDATRVVVDQARTFNTDINFDDVLDDALEEELRTQAERQGGEEDDN